MNRLHRIATGSTIAFALLALPVVSHAGPLGPTKPSQLVSLTYSGATCSVGGGTKADTRAMGDGSTAPFTIPAGQVLVITGVQWNESGSGTADSSFLYLVGSGGTAVVSVGAGLVGTGGYGGGNFGVSGVVVKPGTDICIGLNSLSTAYPTVQGYLTKDK